MDFNYYRSVHQLSWRRGNRVADGNRERLAVAGKYSRISQTKSRADLA